MTTRSTAAMLAIAGLLLVGCAEDEPGTPTGSGTASGGVQTPAPSSPGGGAPPPEGGDAPKVDSPVSDVEKYMKKPCSAVSDKHAADIKFDGSRDEQPENKTGPQCQLTNRSGDTVAVGFVADQPLGLSGVYRNKQEFPDFYEYFEPTEVSGYPAVYANSIDDRDQGGCALSVGITDQQIISVVAVLSDSSKDPCAAVEDVAEAAVATMAQG